jgi:hypothetical protein
VQAAKVFDPSIGATTFTTEYEPVLDAYFKEARGSEGPGVVLRVYGGRLPEYEIVVNTQISRHSIFRYYPRAIDLGERLQPRETTSKSESVQNGGAQNSFLENGSRSAERRIARTYCASEQDRYFNLRASPAQGFRGSRISATDGLSFEIITIGGESRARVTDTDGSRIISQNPALLQWALDLQKASGTP